MIMIPVEDDSGYMETIKRLKEENAKLQAENDELEGTNRMWKDEIERLETKSQYWFNRFNELEKDDMPNGEDVF